MAVYLNTTLIGVQMRSYRLYKFLQTPFQNEGDIWFYLEPVKQYYRQLKLCFNM